MGDVDASDPDRLRSARSHHRAWRCAQLIPQRQRDHERAEVVEPERQRQLHQHEQENLRAEERNLEPCSWIVCWTMASALRNYCVFLVESKQKLKTKRKGNCKIKKPTKILTPQNRLSFKKGKTVQDKKHSTNGNLSPKVAVYSCVCVFFSRFGFFIIVRRRAVAPCFCSSFFTISSSVFRYKKETEVWFYSVVNM